MNDKNAIVTWPPGNTDGTGWTCSNIAAKALDGYFPNCTAIHNQIANICKCGPEEPPFTCPLCGNGIDLPEPNRVVAGKTCDKWQFHATYNASTVDCPYYQKSVGAYCGCDITEPNYFDGFCKLCKDQILPDYNKDVQFVDGTQKSCVAVEVDTNAYSYSKDCEQEQNKYASSCCTNGLEELPTLSPTQKKSAARNEMQLSSSIFNVVNLLLLPVIMMMMS